MNKEAQTIHDNILSLYNNIYSMQEKITNCKKEISKLNQVLYDTCEHEWIYDECAPFDARCKYICKFCKLSRKRSYN